MASLDYFKFLFALLIVLGLIAGLTWVARRFGLAPRVTAGAMKGSRSGRPRRLDIVEILNVDARRRLMLIRRDGVEHLVMIGERDLVIESGIPAKDGAIGEHGR